MTIAHQALSLVEKVESVQVRFKLRLRHQRSMSLEESLSITTGRCNLAIATHARKMHKKYQYDCQLEYFS